MNYTRDIVEAAPAMDEALITVDGQGTRRSWPFAELADGAARLAGSHAPTGSAGATS